MKIKHYFVLPLIATAAVITSCAEEVGGPGGQELRGCMESTAVNYNPDANTDDGSCVQIAKKQNSILVKFTATWCQPCGEWGVPAFQELYDQNKGNVLAVTAQVDDDLTTAKNGPITEAFDLKWNYSGTPNFAVNNTMLNTSYYNANGAISTNSSTAPKIGTNLKYTIGAGANAGKLNINAYAKAFEPLSGQYYMGVYVVAKKIVAYQNGIGNGHEHHLVMLDAVTDDVWGDEIIAATATKDQVFNKQYVFEYDPSWKLSDISIQTVIWKKVGNSYEYINSTVD